MIILKLFLLYFTLSLIGYGGSLFVFGKNYSRWICFCIWAPILGLTWLTLCGTGLIFLNYPVSSWSGVILLLSLIVSFFISWISMKGPIEPVTKSYLEAFYWFLSGGFVALILLALPVILGGLNFTLLRGNGADSFNYILMADLLEHIPYDVAVNASPDWLTFKHSFYPLAQSLILSTRWPVSMLLALFSRWLDIPVYQFEYSFSLFFLLLEYAVVFLLALKCRFKPYLSMLFALSICLGFWGQWLVDIRAQSQISVMPIIIALMILLVHLEKKNKEQYWKESLCFFGMMGALFLLYIEVIPIVFFGGFLLWVGQCFKKSPNVRSLLPYYGIAFLCILLLMLPHFDYWVTILTGGLKQATDFKNTWENSYFLWLYANPLAGIWGLGMFSGKLPQWIGSIVGFLLTVLSFMNIKWIYQHRAVKEISPVDIILAVFFAGAVSFFYLFCHHQFWAAGKAISYVYPLLLILPMLVVFGVEHEKMASWYWKGARIVAWFWLGFQIVLSFIHIYNVTQDKEYSRYMSFNGLYKQHIWQSADIENAVFLHCKTLSFSLPHDTFEEYWSFVLGWKLPITALTAPGHCILMDKSSPLFQSSENSAYLAQNGEVFLRFI